MDHCHLNNCLMKGSLVMGEEHIGDHIGDAAHRGGCMDSLVDEMGGHVSYQFLLCTL